MVIKALGECFRHLGQRYGVCWEPSQMWEGPALCHSGFAVVFAEPRGGRTLYFSWSSKGWIYVLQVST